MKFLNSLKYANRVDFAKEGGVNAPIIEVASLKDGRRLLGACEEINNLLIGVYLMLANGECVRFDESQAIKSILNVLLG